MTHAGRFLCAIYAAVTLWLTFCTIATFGHVPLWTSIVMAAASIATIVAGLRESTHADELRAVRVDLERAARPADVTPVISQAERAVFDELVAGLGMDDAA
ncbi:hypothetical protein [Streptomyces sp. S1D4-20]|uniref:hypothetical protein n=1 Tax=Streptomyces sp. S1D4-20 TaxID=2594462 RepID=UPI0011652428|nr:hypothetical protein [Streptomyces sp. S1D4-20]QDN57358.1 hypothetical protein FNV67_20240 [Streptomyces sp. S1D4-20]